MYLKDGPPDSNFRIALIFIDHIALCYGWPVFHHAQSDFAHYLFPHVAGASLATGRNICVVNNTVTDWNLCVRSVPFLLVTTSISRRYWQVLRFRVCHQKSTQTLFCSLAVTGLLFCEYCLAIYSVDLF